MIKAASSTGVALLVFLLIACTPAKARIVNAGSSGNWSNTSTWGGMTPGCGDTIQIPAGITVTVNNVYDYSACTQWMRIVIHGVMTFQTGKKLRLPCNSMIVIATGGLISGGGGGGSSNLIDICSITVWTTAMGDIPGPATLGNEPLPVLLLAFSGEVVDGGVNLKWITASEIDNKVFYIGKSSDGKSFPTIAAVQGAGNSNTLVEYEFRDETPYNGLTYYRLTQVDFDGDEDISKVIAVRYNPKGSFKLFPNPCDEDLFCSLSSEFANQQVKVVLQTFTGIEVLSKYMYIENQLRGVRLLNRRDLSKSGFYIISIELNGDRIAQPLVVR